MGPGKDKMGSVVLGIGINLNQTVRDLSGEIRSTATSLYLSSGKKTDRLRFFQQLLLRLEESYGWLTEGRFSKVLAEWRKRAGSLDQQVRVTQGHHVFYGHVVGLDERGALLVRTDSGMVETVLSGDVVVLKTKSRNVVKSGKRRL
jgi:BirA family biotin operon repressor/biotin-[acetyl-CoA-carboxylase] ligase